MADGSACPEESGIQGDADGKSRRGRHRVEMSLLPLKKRALNDDSSSGRYSNSDGTYSPSPKKTRKDVEAEGDAMPDAEKLCLSKGKWKAAAETSSIVAPHQPPVKKQKLMQNGSEAAHGSTTAEKKQSNQPEAILGGAVWAQLAELGATRPWFVHQKQLEKSDMCSNQNRLLVSCKCKRDSLARCPITRCFSAAEMRRVEDKSVGLAVTALDGGGVGFPLTCKHLDSNESYRFIFGWGNFLMPCWVTHGLMRIYME